MGISARAVFTPRGNLGRFVAARITPGVVASVQASVNMIRDAAQGYCPVETGALRDSITASVDSGGKTVVGKVTTSLDYAPYVEWGTGQRGAESPDAGAGPYNPNWPGMSPRPYMRPAFDEARGAVLDLFRANISLSM